MAPKVACPSVEQLSSFLRGESEDSELADLGAHLETCSSCQEKARTVVAEDTLLDRARGDFSRTDKLAEAVPPTFVERLKSLARSQNSGHASTVEVGAEGNAEEAKADFLLPAQRSDEIGRLGPYRILDVLGKGGMGMVFLAHDPRLDRQVALKVMLPKFAAHETAKLRFLREARAAAKVKSDHIVHIYEVEESRGVPYLAMELMEGMPLDQFLHSHPKLSIPQILQIARDTAKGLAAAHDKGLIHRDIKPGNLWLDQGNAGRVKILDFGLARAEKEDVQMTQSGAIVGTPAYMAPEQARGNQPIDARADLFSLGCVLYRLCSGELPFKSDTTMGMLLAIATEEPPLPTTYAPDLPPELCELIMQLLQKDPAKRPASAKAVITRLAEIDQKYRARGTETTAVASSLISPPTPSAPTISEVRPAPTAPRRRSPFAAAIGAAFLGGALLLAGVVFFWQTPEGTVRVESNDPTIKIAFDEGELKIVGAYKEALSLKPGKHGLKIQRGDDFVFETDKLVLAKGDEVRLRIEVLPGKVQIAQDGKGVLGEKNLPKELVKAAPPDPDSSPAATGFALEFDGKTSLVEIPTLAIDDAGPFSMEAWVRPKQLEGLQVVFQIGGKVQRQFNLVSDRWKAIDNGYAGSLDNFQAKAVVDKEVHLAYVVGDQGARFFVDGKLVQQTPTPAKLKPTQITHTWLGGEKLGAKPIQYGFSGRIGQCRVSKSLRYAADFTPPNHFQRDNDTIALYHFNEGAGDKLTDSSGNGHHGKIVGAKWVKSKASSIRTPTVPGEFALRITRDLGTKGVSLPDVKLDPNGPATIEAYCAHGDYQGSLISIPRLSISSSPAKWALQAGAGIPGSKGQPFVRGARTHLAAVRSGNKATLFVNGKQVDQLTGLDDQSKVKRSNLHLAWGLTGIIQEVRVSSTARYMKDFTPQDRFEPDADTVALYHCDEGSGSKLIDSSGNGYHGEILSGTWVKADGKPIPKSPSTEDLALRIDTEGRGQAVEVERFLTDEHSNLTFEAYCTPETQSFGSVVATGQFGLSIITPPNQGPLWAVLGGDSNQPFAPVVPGKRVHIAAVRTKDGAELFVDGKLATRFTKVVKLAKLEPLRIGWPFKGTLDEIRISKVVRYTKAFTPQARFESDADTLALYHCDEGSGNKLVDFSGNNRHGKVLAASWVKSEASVAPPILPAGDYAMRFKYKFRDKGALLPTLKFDLDSPVTIEAYCTPEEFRQGSLFGGTTFGLYTSGNRWALANGAGLVSGKAPEIELGKRVHIAGVRTSEGAKLFVNGKLADQAPNGKVSPTTTFFLGTGFTGLIDELRVSNSARYDKDFTPEARFAPDKDTVALYHFDEGFGDVFEDASGNGHHGRTENATWAHADGSPVVAKPRDFALRFDGNGQVEVPKLHVATEKRITVEAFVKLHHSPDTGFVNLVGHGNLSSSLDDVRFQAQFGGTSTSFGNSSVTAGEESKRIHVAAVLTDTELAMFWDGKKGATTPLTPRVQGDIPAFLIGSFKFHGVLDEIRVSKTARYTKSFAPQRRFELDADTLALYHCDEGEGDVLKDSSGNGHHGKIVGATWVYADGTPKGVSAAPPPLDPAWFKAVAALPADRQVEAVKTELTKRNGLLDSQVAIAASGSSITISSRNTKNGATSLPPLDISPIRALTKLQQFTCNDPRLSDLSPLKELKLTDVSCFMTSVADLSPLKNMQLSNFDCSHSKVADLSPLQGMPLKYLSFSGTQVTDLSPLKGMPLKHLKCDFQADRDAALLRSIPSLEWINDRPASDVLKGAATSLQPLDPAWLKAVAAMPSDKQFEAVKAELMKRNPDFDGAMTPTFINFNVTDLRLQADNVADLTPLQALTSLKTLNCNSTPRKSQLVDLSPLKGLKLSELYFQYAHVTDLSPLREMKLTKLGFGNTSVTDLSPLQGMPLEALYGSGSKVSDLSPLRGMPLTYLELGGTPVVDLAPLKGMKLDSLYLSNTKVADLSPLRGMPLTRLSFPITPVADLTPLQGMPLTSLICNGARVADLAPLKGMKLTRLNVGDTNVADLAPLQGMPLVQLYCNNSRVNDLSPVKNMPIKELGFDVRLDRDGAVLRTLPALELINGKPAAEVLKTGQTSTIPALDPAWLKSVAAMTADEQVKAVVAELKKRNPEFEGNVKHRVNKEGFVWEFLIHSGNVADISPVRALQRLQTFGCSQAAKENENGYGKLVDLTPLQGMHLDNLHLQRQAVRDLSPLEGMQFRTLDCQNTLVADLTPLKKIDADLVLLNRTPLSDLSPLRGTRISKLDITGTKVTDLSPLSGSPLKHLHVQDAKVADFSPLQGMPLEFLSAGGTLIADLAPLKGMPLKTLILGKTRITDLEPLRGMPLRHLQVSDTWVASLAPLRGLSIDTLYVQGTKVRDLTPLEGMPLRTIYCNFDLARDGAVLRSLKSLESINGIPASKQLP
jgi:serine/threonine protein kinase/Leucine-rich repeat (LRR) protein